ncbi:MAG: hypothetical protein R3321_00500 [Nitrososphaeraceae archaeon]|nr:hypothetical protein [Nitrososphaeraceae archaeon]
MDKTELLFRLQRKINQAQNIYEGTKKPEDSGFLYGLYEAKQLIEDMK